MHKNTHRMLGSAGLCFVAGIASSLLGCAGSWPQVLDPTDIVTLREGTPRIQRVRDLGSAHIGKAGPLVAESDGVLTVGELLLIEGSGLGKQPTVGIASRAAEVRWRTEGGGIVVQLPTGTPSGPQTLWVEAGGKRAETQVSIRRLAVVLDARHGRLHTVQLGGERDQSLAVTAVGTPLAVPGARKVALSADGSTAFVLQRDDSGNDRISVVDLVAPQGPRLHLTRPVQHQVHSLLSAEGAPVLAAVGPDQVTLWDIREARQPAAWPPSVLPEGCSAAYDAALSPNGSLLALPIAESNVVQFVSLRSGRTAVTAQAAGQVSALPQQKQALLQSLRFSSDGETLWLSSGDRPSSWLGGHQPTRLLAIQIGAVDKETSTRSFTVLKTVELRDAGAPLDLVLGKSPPIAAATTIRTPPEKATLFLTTVASASYSADAAGRTPQSALLRSDLTGNTQALWSGKALLTGLDTTPDAQHTVSARVNPGAAGLSVTLTHVATGASTSLSLGAAEVEDLEPARGRVSVLVQP